MMQRVKQLDTTQLNFRETHSPCTIARFVATQLPLVHELKTSDVTEQRLRDGRVNAGGEDRVGSGMKMACTFESIQ